MTNFDKLINDMKNMSIHEFSKRFYPCLGCKFCVYHTKNDSCNYRCSDNIERYLESEVEE